jgi:hypothetical protein
MDLGKMTVDVLLEQLREEELRARAEYIEARRRFDRARAAIAAIEAVADDAMEARPGQGELPIEAEELEAGEDALRGERAVLAVLATNTTRIWSSAIIHRHLERHGWINADARNPRAGTEAALSRLVQKGVVARIAPGRYRVRDVDAVMELRNLGSDGPRPTRGRAGARRSGTEG